jgi:cold shock CspA family protein
MRKQGTVLWFDQSRGHGMVQYDGDQQIVVHLDSVESPTMRGLSDGQGVDFSLEEGPEGKFAGSVRIMVDKGESARPASRLRKTIGKSEARLLDASGPLDASSWIALDRIAHFELSSEAAEHPIDNALDSTSESGWRASEPGPQTIRIRFDAPQQIRRIQLRFVETEQTRTQEFSLRWSRSGRDAQEIVRQQWNFSPGGATEEKEDYTVDLPNVDVLELAIRPEIGGGSAFATLAGLRVA